MGSLGVPWLAGMGMPLFPTVLSYHPEAVWWEYGGSPGTVAGPSVSDAASSQRSEGYIFSATTFGIKIILTVSQI